MSYEIQASLPTQCAKLTLAWSAPAGGKRIEAWVEGDNYFAERIAANVTGTLGTVDWVCGECAALTDFGTREESKEEEEGVLTLIRFLRHLTFARLSRRSQDRFRDLQVADRPTVRDDTLLHRAAGNHRCLPPAEPGPTRDGFDGCARE